MNMVAFDTLTYSKRLQEAGVPSAQAEAHAIAQADFLTHYLLSEVATKTDLAEVKAELKTDIAEVKTELKTDIAEVKAELKAEIAEIKADLKTEIAEVKTEIAEVKAELKTDIAELKTEIAGIKTDMAEMETRLTMRMLFMVGILATLMTVFKFIG